MDRVLRIGFRKVGDWLRTDAGVSYKLDGLAPHPNTLYAFVVDGDVRYVGKTTKTLRGRLNGYVRPSDSQSTNKRIQALIRSALDAASSVEIYALPDEGLHHIGVFHLNLAAGLEDSIIRTLDPLWNGGRKAPVEPEVDTEEEIDVSCESQAASAFSFVLGMQKSYWNGGFFNAGVAATKLFGADGQTLEIFLDDAPEPILGSINRTSAGNSSPRIFGGRLLRFWFQERVREDGLVNIEVLSPTAIRLRPLPA
jgi:hypothetical protein